MRSQHHSVTVQLWCVFGNMPGMTGSFSTCMATHLLLIIASVMLVIEITTGTRTIDNDERVDRSLHYTILVP